MGGSGSPVKAAIAASPFSTTTSALAAWWGRPVTISTRSLHVSGSTATAVVVASAGGKKVGSQQVSLTRTNGRWALVTPLVDEPFGTITGPLAARKPTAQEQAAISAAGFKVLKGEQDCVRFVVAVSTIDPGFASARLIVLRAAKGSVREQRDAAVRTGRPPGGWTMTTAPEAIRSRARGRRRA